jgi:hypothetical protein
MFLMEIGKRVPYGFQMAVRSYRRSYRTSQLQHKRTLTYCRGSYGPCVQIYRLSHQN